MQKTRRQDFTSLFYKQYIPVCTQFGLPRKHISINLLFRLFFACFLLISIFGDGCFLSLSVLVGEPAPLPTPRKVNASNSASEPPKAPKRSKVAPALPPRTSSMGRDNANGFLSRENAEHVREGRCAPIDENAMPLNPDVGFIRRTNHEEAQSLIKTDCTPNKKAEMSQREKMPDNTTIDTSSKSREDSNDGTEKNSELQSDIKETIDVRSGESALKSKDKSQDRSLNEDEFNREKTMPDIVNDVENQRSYSLDQRPSDGEELHLKSDESKESRLSECKDVAERRGNNSPRDDEINSKSIDYFDENERQLLDVSSTSDSHSLSETQLDRATDNESRNEQLQLPRRSTCQRPPRAPRRTIPSSYGTGEADEETVRRACPRDVTNDAAVKNNFDRDTCTVISTIPKCEHLDRAVTEDSASSNMKRGLADRHEVDRRLEMGATAEDVIDKSHEKLREDQTEETGGIGAKCTKRAKIRTKARSQCKSDDFEVDSLKRQRRYLTSPPENIAHALNLNLPATRNSISSNVAGKEWEESAAGHCAANGDTRDADVDKRESHGGLVTGACCCTTNILF